MKKQDFESIINYIMKKGADFSELFFENSLTRVIKYINNKKDDVKVKKITGLGIRIKYHDEVIYISTNEKDINKIYLLIDKTFKLNENKEVKISLKRLKKYQDDVVITHDEFTNLDRVFDYINSLARKSSSLVSQVEVDAFEYDQDVIIANSLGLYRSDHRVLSRLYLYIYVTRDQEQRSVYYAPGFKMGYEYLDTIDFKKIVPDLVNRAIKLLDAVAIKGGEMPVIIGNGFGGVIFHEACGHGLEATSVSQNFSVFSNMLGQEIATKKVTLIDDGTIKKSWGSSNIDDEGNVTQKNILIKNGVLNRYLVDYINVDKMKHEITSSSRRESYKYAPTSRMSNTYLSKGTLTIEEMIQSIKYGLYAYSMGGGSVNPYTGDFNFAVREAYLIEDGKVTKAVQGASLIGNSKDILKQVTMVSDDLSLESGFCGSVSGNVPTTVGEPTIKVDKILVGGSE